LQRWRRDLSAGAEGAWLGKRGCNNAAVDILRMLFVIRDQIEKEK
jgi:hypothetical protein